MPHHSQSKASTTSPEFHWSLPLPEKKGASDWSRPRRSHRYQEVRRRRLYRSPASPTLARTPVSPQHPSLAALGFVLAGAVSRRRRPSAVRLELDRTIHVAPYRFAQPRVTDEWGHPLKQPAGALRLAGRPVRISRAAQQFKLNLFLFKFKHTSVPNFKNQPRSIQCTKLNETNFVGKVCEC